MSLETQEKRDVKEDVGGLCALKVLPGSYFLFFFFGSYFLLTN